MLLNISNPCMTPDKQEEIIKLQKIIKQCEGIVRTSRNPQTLQRLKIDLKKAKDKLDYLCPDGVPNNLTYTNEPQEVKVDIHSQLQSYVYLPLFPVHKLSPHCEKDEINFFIHFN